NPACLHGDLRQHSCETQSKSAWIPSEMTVCPCQCTVCSPIRRGADADGQSQRDQLLRPDSQPNSTTGIRPADKLTVFVTERKCVPTHTLTLSHPETTVTIA